jgi:HEAT repeats
MSRLRKGWCNHLPPANIPAQAIMKLKRILLGVAIGILAVVGGIRVLISTLGNDQPTLFRDQPLDYWTREVKTTDVTASNQANSILNAEIIPGLTDKMFRDTNDSKIRMALVDTLNDLPGIMIYYSPAAQRRSEAMEALGSFGPAAKAAIPALMQAAQSNDPAVREAAIRSLGAIHGEPEVVIPFLTKYLDDDTVNDEAATALGNYGSLARPAIPKITPLLHAADDDAQVAALAALRKIDPAAYANATNTPAN